MSEIDDFDSPLGSDAESVRLHDLFQQARLPGTVEELSSEAAVVVAMARTIAQPPLVSDISARRRLVTSKTAARTAIVAAALFVGTSTAAAAGILPDAAQSAVSRAGSHLGVEIPDPYDEARSGASASEQVTTAPSVTSTASSEAAAVTNTSGDAAPSRGSALPTRPGIDPNGSITPAAQPAIQPPTPGTTAGRGPDPTGPAKHGLCQAWASHANDSPANQNSTAMRNLQAAAAAAGQTVEEFCADVVNTEPAEAAATTAAPPPTTVVDGPGNKKKDTNKPGPGTNGPPGEDKKDKKPKGGG